MMKIVFAFILASGISYFVYAETNEEAVAGREHKMRQMRHEGSMSGMMMGMSRSMVVAHDGGVFVLVGNKLQKYDKNLVLQKEVEIKMPKDMMRHMKKKCPMMGGSQTPARGESAGQETKSAEVSQ
jgi:hypothetical protein